MSPKGKQLTLSDRIAIETGLMAQDSLKKIAAILGKHPTTISQEIKNNRTFVVGTYSYGNDCRYAKNCGKHNVCGNTECTGDCVRCKSSNCHEFCDKYVSLECERHHWPPYVCNACNLRKTCKKNRYFYSATYADAAVSRRRSESRRGIHLSDEELAAVDALVSDLIAKGQPLSHIYAEHSDEIPVTLRTLYNYIDDERLTARNIDLRRKVGYKPRKKPRKKSGDFMQQEFRKGRSYEDFEHFIEKHPGIPVTEMDTVKGKRQKGKCLLTMIFRDNSVMLLFLLPDCKAESVKRIFDYLEAGLGEKLFKQLFPVFLTDNGSEFKRPDDMELTAEYTYRTRVFYCDPMASWQKPHIEKNHEYIRYVIPKGQSMDAYTQEDMTLLANHINSTKRPSLGNKSPYDIAISDDNMIALMSFLKMHPILPDEVHLLPDLFTRNP